MLHLEQLHIQRDKEVIDAQRTEMRKFLKFLNKVNNKIRKHVLGIEHTKQRKQGELVSDTHEVRFQFKVLVDRLIQKEQLQTHRSQKPAEIVSDLKDCWSVAHDYQGESKRLRKELDTLKLEIQAQLDKSSCFESNIRIEIGEKDGLIGQLQKSVQQLTSSNNDLKSQIQSQDRKIQRF